MNVTTQPVSFLPTTAAQPTDVLRRDNAQREVITPLKPKEAFHRERGLGSDSDRRTPAQERSYAQQLAQARVEAGFPYFIKQVNRQPNHENSQAPQGKEAKQTTQKYRTHPEVADVAAESSQSWAHLNSVESVGFDVSTTLTYRDNEGHFATLSFNRQGDTLDQAYLARGQRIEHYYQSSYRPTEQFLLGVA